MFCVQTLSQRLEMHFVMTAIVLPIFTRATISKNNTTINQQQSQGRGGRRPSACCTGIGRQQQQLRTRPSNIIARSCSFVRRRHQCHRIIIFLVAGDCDCHPAMNTLNNKSSKQEVVCGLQGWKWTTVLQIEPQYWREQQSQNIMQQLISSRKNHATSPPSTTINV